MKFKVTVYLDSDGKPARLSAMDVSIPAGMVAWDDVTNLREVLKGVLAQAFCNGDSFRVVVDAVRVADNFPV